MASEMTNVERVALALAGVAAGVSLSDEEWRIAVSDRLTQEAVEGFRAQARAAIEAMRPMGRDDLLRATDDKTLVGLVMTLTGGGASPATAQHHLARLRAELT